MSSSPRRRRGSSPSSAARGLGKAPGIAETLDWVQALSSLGETSLRTEVVDATLGAVIKSHEDL